MDPPTSSEKACLYGSLMSQERVKRRVATSHRKRKPDEGMEISTAALGSDLVSLDVSINLESFDLPSWASRIFCCTFLFRCLFWL